MNRCEIIKVNWLKKTRTITTFRDKDSCTGLSYNPTWGMIGAGSGSGYFGYIWLVGYLYLKDHGT